MNSFEFSARTEYSSRPSLSQSNLSESKILPIYVPIVLNCVTVWQCLAIFFRNCSLSSGEKTSFLNLRFNLLELGLIHVMLDYTIAESSFKDF